MSESLKKNRPEFRNINAFKDLPHYRWPLASLVSGGHRFGGLMLVLLLPLMLYLLDKSLLSETSFEYLKGFTSGWFVKLLVMAMAWPYLHHFCAGIRHLLADLHVGLEKDAARKSAVWVFAISVPLAALVALKLFGVI